MARKSKRTLQTYLRLLVRDAKRSMKKLVRIRRHRGQLVITLTSPGFKTSRTYYSAWRMMRKSEAPLRRNVAVAYLLLVIGGGTLAISLVQLSALQPDVPRVAATGEVLTPLVKKPTGMSKSLPTRLSIPDITVDTALIQLGRNDDGSMQTPDSYELAGWYQYSPTPGEIGPAVITGHVDSYQGAAVFFRLKELQPGQKIAVTRADGTTATFSVSKIEQFEQDHFPTDAVYGNTDDAQLRLITCGGPFNHLSGEYTQNTVVFAVLDTPS